MSRLLALLTQIIGIPNLPIRILSVLPWPLAVRIADEIRFERIFLAGDAAHTMTPYAGKGTNTGVQDVHNLAWKLRAVIAEGADEQLLATYQAERQEVGAFYARLSGDMAASNGLIDDQRLAGQGAVLIGLPNYHYASEAIVGELSGNQEVHYFTGQPGTRLPHCWVDEAKQHSTLDWINGRFILIASGDPARWESTARQCAREPAVVLPVYGFTSEHARQRWQRITSTGPGDALLIRPDGFVAARLPSILSVEELISLVRKVGGKNEVDVSSRKMLCYNYRDFSVEAKSSFILSHGRFY